MIRKEFLIIAITTFITVVAWVIFDIVHSLSEVTIDPKVEKIIIPVNAEFDTSSLEPNR